MKHNNRVICILHNAVHTYSRTTTQTELIKRLLVPCLPILWFLLLYLCIVRLGVHYLPSIVLAGYLLFFILHCQTLFYSTKAVLCNRQLYVVLLAHCSLERLLASLSLRIQSIDDRSPAHAAVAATIILTCHQLLG